ncbi:MAG: tRNA (guanosine(37)-N1)-methyltransferase TrmD [Patescibacteria group bacterium]
MLTFHIISIFPNSFSYLDESMLQRAKETKKIKIKIYNPRDFSVNKHKKVDDRPYGGGPGMVLAVDPIIKAWNKAKGKSKNIKTIILSPRGKQFENKEAIKLSKNYKDIILIAGHYEGIDARVKKITKAEEVSVGPYVLTGGELPAMILVDAITRQIKGVLKDENSLEEKRIAGKDVYTRPETYGYNKKKYKVPKVLLSGHHKNIDNFRKS